jgi:hypothetical protein
MIGNTHIPEQTIVRNDTFTEFDNSRFVLIVQVSLHESFADLDDLTEGEMLTWDPVQAARSLNYLLVSVDRSGVSIDQPALSPNPALEV